MSGKVDPELNNRRRLTIISIIISSSIILEKMNWPFKRSKLITYSYLNEQNGDRKNVCKKDDLKMGCKGGLWP